MTVPENMLRYFEGVPITRTLGMRLDALSSDGAVVSMEPDAAYVQDTGVVQGGIISALADAAAVYALVPDLPHGASLTSIEFKVNFLRPAVPGRGPVVAESRIVQRGRRVALCDVEVSQAGRLVAKGSFTYLFLEPASPER